MDYSKSSWLFSANLYHFVNYPCLFYRYFRYFNVKYIDWREVNFLPKRNLIKLIFCIIWCYKNYVFNVSFFICKCIGLKMHRWKRKIKIAPWTLSFKFVYKVLNVLERCIKLLLTILSDEKNYRSLSMLMFSSYKIRTKYCLL